MRKCTMVRHNRGHYSLGSSGVDAWAEVQAQAARTEFHEALLGWGKWAVAYKVYLPNDPFCRYYFVEATDEAEPQIATVIDTSHRLLGQVLHEYHLLLRAYRATAALLDAMAEQEVTPVPNGYLKALTFVTEALKAVEGRPDAGA